MYGIVRSISNLYAGLPLAAQRRAAFTILSHHPIAPALLVGSGGLLGATVTIDVTESNVVISVEHEASYFVYSHFCVGVQ